MTEERRTENEAGESPASGAHGDAGRPCAEQGQGSWEEATGGGPPDEPSGMNKHRPPGDDMADRLAGDDGTTNQP